MSGSTNSNPSSYNWLAVNLSALSVLCWAVLYRWYALFEHYATPGFGLDQLPGHFESPQLRLTTLLFVLLAAVYVGMYWLINQTPALSRTIKAALVFLIAGAGVANVFMHPVGAIDVFYYLSELKLTYYYRQNPYLVTFLPTFAGDPFVKVSAFLEWPLVYGPAWVVAAGGPAVLVGYNDLLPLLVTYKGLSLLFVLASGWCIYRAYDDQRSAWRGAYLFLGNPLIMFEAVGNAHNDIIMAAFLLAAALALKRQSGLAPALLLLAALTKAFAVVLFPVLLYEMYRQKWNRMLIILSFLLAAGVGGAIILPFWSQGEFIGGMARAVASQQRISTASIVSLVQEYMQQHGLHDTVRIMRAGLASLFALGAAVVIATVKERERVLAYLLLLVYTLVSSIFPWYLIPVIGLLAVKHNRADLMYIFAASGLALISYPVSVWARFNSGMNLFQMRLCVALLLTLPIVLLFAAEITRQVRRRAQTTSALAKLQRQS